MFPRPAFGYGYKPEEGYKWGEISIYNHCNETFFFSSVGAWRLGGPKITTTYGGLGSPCDREVKKLVSGAKYTEFYRQTCPRNYSIPSPKDEYCADDDKLAGQAISIKIARDKILANGVTQIEYALMQDPNRGDTFNRLNYDISLLDCVRRDDITDAGATAQQHEEKVRGCPGYQGGIAVTFPHDVQGSTNCPPIYCNGTLKCDMIYTWDRSRPGEASLACAREYKGEMRVDLCANKNVQQKV
ncbi:hypothetical protein B0J11DRAFT_440335 [Dendryphion nanum]|uniref:Uncharacterized protein n=1 Tax=Dendryphion nanum TaxID=256645 RepID=A0A9P9DH94_9PLEO|nr:hypothetical protein B0J11DRAFT_440335 [Dendryphion nanum]